jgi:hypothetical protein
MEKSLNTRYIHMPSHTFRDTEDPSFEVPLLDVYREDVYLYPREDQTDVAKCDAYPIGEGPLKDIRVRHGKK